LDDALKMKTRSQSLFVHKNHLLLCINIIWPVVSGKKIVEIVDTRWTTDDRWRTFKWSQKLILSMAQVS